MLFKFIDFIVAIPFIAIGWIYAVIESGFSFGYEHYKLGEYRKETVNHLQHTIKQLKKHINMMERKE